jgi:hypothetical protein
MNTQEDINYQVRLLREISEIDILKAFDCALCKIESLENCFANAMHLFNEAMLEVKEKGSTLCEIEELCKKSLFDRSTQINPHRIISIINKKDEL